ncbi:MAG: M16 family metallopeptidase [Vampirovibrionales bacterium]
MIQGFAFRIQLLAWVCSVMFVGMGLWHSVWSEGTLQENHSPVIPEKIKVLESEIKSPSYIPKIHHLETHPMQGLTMVHVTLENGHQLFVIQRPGTPVMTLDTWVATGSKHEIPDNNGVSHFLEHLLFKGTESFAPRVIDNDWANKGITFNAATSKDFTHYYQVMPSTHFPTVAKQHAEMLLKARIPTEELDAERKVVQQEISRALDNPMAQLFNALYEQQFPTHPYALTTLGPASLIGTIPRDTIMAYYRQWYHPQNFYTIAVGDLPPQETLKHLLIGFYGGGVASQYLHPLPQAQEDPHYNPKLTPNRTKLLALPSLKTTTGVIALQAPTYQTPLKERLALELALSILTMPKTGVLHRTLVDQERRVDTLSAGVDFSRDASVLYMYFKSPKVDHLHPTLQQIHTLMQQVIQEGFKEKDVQRAIQQAVKTYAFQQESSEDMANALGQTLTSGGSIETFTNYLPLLKTLTAKDLQAALSRWWQPNTMSFTAIVPDNTDTPPIEATITHTLASWHEGTPWQHAVLPQEAPLQTAPKLAPNTKLADTEAQTLETLLQRLLPPQGNTTETGSLKSLVLPYASDKHETRPSALHPRGKLVIKQTPGVETVHLKLFFKPTYSEGWSHTAAQRQLLSSTLTEATRRYTPQALQAWMQSEGLFAEVGSDDDYLTLHLSSTKDSLPALMKLGEALCLTPQFPQEALSREWTQLKTQLHAISETPSTTLFDTFSHSFYAPESPYGQSSTRLLAQLKKLPSQKDMQTYWHHLRGQSEVTAVAVGQFSAQETVQLQQQVSRWIGSETSERRMVEASLEDSLEGSLKDNLPPTVHVALKASRTETVVREKQADTWVLVARSVPGLSVLKQGKNDPQVRFALAVRVLNAILGDGMNSRYFVELREKQGLAYEVGGFQELHTEQGAWVSYIGTTPDHETTVKAGFQKELQRIADGDFTPETLEAAKQKLMGSFLVRHESPEAQLNYLGMYETAGVGASFDALYPDWISTVSAEELQQAAQTLLHQPSLTVVVRPK